MDSTIAIVGATAAGMMALFALVGYFGRGYVFVRTHLTAELTEEVRAGRVEAARTADALSNLADCVVALSKEQARQWRAADARWAEHVELHRDHKAVGHSVQGRVERNEVEIARLALNIERDKAAD